MRLICFVALIWLILAAIIGCTTIFSRLQPEQSKLEAFGLETCGSRLCYQGISPGVTTLSKALAILKQHGLIQSSETKYPQDLDFGSVRVGYDAQTQLVNYIVIFDQSGAGLPLTLGDFIKEESNPCGFNPYLITDHAIGLTYPHAHIEVSADFPGIKPSTPIIAIGLQSSGDACDTDMAWHGFATFDHYYALYGNSWR